MFGTMIQERRIALNLSQKDLAEAVGITQAHLSRLESGVADPRKLRHEIICNLAGKLAVPLAELSQQACNGAEAA
jgi:transcriptional regulator with XRE-family HTH domain